MTNNYRKIWEEHNQQKIPKGYHIHHIDGNHDNNDPLNLECLSAAEHWQRHYEQGDIVAIHGKFIQGASEAGKKGGANGKGKPKNWGEGRQSQIMKESYEKRGGSSLKGCTLTDEHIENITLALQGENNPMFGKKHTEESISLMRINRGSLEGENNPMFGKTQSAEAKQKISDKAKGRKSKMKGRINETTRSRKYKWYNDGTTSFFMPEGTQPENYKLGRIKTWKN
jgi:hypothetical protein